MITHLSADTSTADGHAIKRGVKHELRFVSLFHPGRGVTVPCDAAGVVDIDALSERLRNAYFGARALVGREYAFPTVQLH